MRVEQDTLNPARSSGEMDGWTWRFGAGIEAELVRNLEFVAEGAYHLPEGHINDFEYWSATAGLQFRF